MPFPRDIAGKLAALAARLDAFDTIQHFKYRISDFDPADATRADFPDGDWQTFGEKAPFRHDQGVTWVRVSYTVPERFMDIPLAGSQLRVCPGGYNTLPYFAPLEIYADGKLLLAETAWMDCRCPEGIISESAVPGQTHTIALRLDYGDHCFYDPALPMRIVCDAVESRFLHIDSIAEELGFVEAFEGAERILPKAYELLRRALAEDGTEKVMEAIAQCRRLCEPLREQIKKHKVYLISHAHIDMNWFWSMEETERIIDRDFSTMTNLMQQNPDFCFSQSQCATYAIEEKNNPAVFAKMQEYAEKGQWDITASTWVEGDLNMASGESIARHALYSKRYIADKFGKNPRIMWSPDTFGHSANIPQIMKKSGLDCYFHMRCGIGIDESPFNEYPFVYDYLRNVHHVPLYWWTGQDGSRVLVGNMFYNGEFCTRGILNISAGMRQRFGYDKAMFIFGVGDHGGGPTMRDIRWMREVAEFPTVPTVFFSTAHAFFDQVAADNPAGLPERSGEMGFVFDGCYTTHANIKYYNRRCESDLEATESLCVLAALSGFEYPAQEFERLWRGALFNQFHDILDGCGVKDTYKASDELAEWVLSRLREIADDAMAHIAARACIDDEAGIPFVVFNPTYAVRDECVIFPVEGVDAAVDAEGNECKCQRGAQGILAHVRGIPPLGYKLIYLRRAENSPMQAGAIAEDGEYYRVSTPQYDIELCKGSGQITTLYDRAAKRYVVRRELMGWRLKNGCLNTLQIHYEEPHDSSSWTIGNISKIVNLTRGARSGIAEDGPVRKRIWFEHEFERSRVRQEVVIYNDSPRIDFETSVDWNETGDPRRDAPMLKVCFTPAVQNTCATYEIPFGVIARATGDCEYPSLRWADIGDESYGFSLLNDSKYGHKCCGNVLELTLIRCGYQPDHASDVGSHRFTYSILPHEGDWRAGKTMRHAAFLNNPVRVAAARGGQGGEGVCASVIAADNPDVPICGVKRCEDSDDIVVKLYNPSDLPVRTTARAGFRIGGVCECDFLECAVGGPVNSGADGFEVSLGAHEVKSYRIGRA